MQSWLVLIPPFLVLSCALYTKRIILSLLLGIISAAFIASDFSILNSAYLVFDSLKTQFIEKDNQYLFIFLICFGIVLTIITHTGGAIALGNLITKRLKKSKDAETASLIISSVLAIDDYLNCLTTGYIMRSLSEKFRIPKLKVSFLVDSMTAPLTILIPFSTWAGYTIRELMQSGIATESKQKILIYADPLTTYLKTIPYIFYSFLLILTIWFIVRKSISFGAIGKHEILHLNKNLSENSQNDMPLTKASSLNFFVPMITLITCFFIGVLYTGDFYLFGGLNSFSQAFRNSEIFKVFFYSGFITLITSLIIAGSKKNIKIKDVPSLFKEGAMLMLPAIILIFLAWAFGSLLKNNLNTGQYLASLISGNINLSFLPAIFFLITAAISIIIGSSWGTIAIMLPMVIEIITKASNLPLPIMPESLCLLIPCLGAVLSGAVAGNHLSPIADISMMTTKSVGVNHIEHVKAQFVYALPVFFSTAVAYVISGFLPCDKYLLNISISFGISLILCWSIMLFLNKKRQF